MLSPPRLKKYFFTKLEIKPNFKHELGADVSTDDIGYELTIVRPEQGNIWQTLLSVVIEPDTENNLPYKATLELVGFFDVMSDLHNQPTPKEIASSTGSVLLGISREMLANMMRAGPLEPVYIPTQWVNNLAKTFKLIEPIEEDERDVPDQKQA